MDSPDRDVRGVKRGKCRLCSACTGYRRNLEAGDSKCSNCNCAPGKHKNATTPVEDDDDQPQGLQVSSAFGNLTLDCDSAGTFVGPKCQYCCDDAYFDINTRIQYPNCHDHLQQDPIQSNSNEGIPVVPAIGAHPSNGACGKDPSLCTIEDCYKPRHTDENGKVHECCGYTHAMELSRRRAIERMKQPIVKGITHCLLPDCSNVTWPFMNYCCRTHAEKGKKLGLQSPTQSASGDASATASKDSSLCELPECHLPKRRNSKNGSLYDFCGITHALEADKRGIKVKVVPASDSGPKLDSMCRLDECRKPKRKLSDGTLREYCCKDHAEKAASNASSTTKDDSMCIIPECSRPKYVDPITNKKSDYCSRTHVQEGEKRGIQPVLKSRDEVDVYLKSFGSILTVVDIKENDHAKPDGALYKKFVAARDSLPVSDRKTCLAFHGTADTNIDSICKNGYDPLRRCGQARGPGEYFATTPSTPLGYVQGGKRILLNELLLGQNGVHHTQHGDIVVMKYPEHDLPRFVITFK